VSSHTAWGPLAGLIGRWSSDEHGLDVAFHSDQGKVSETRYREEATFEPFGPVTVGSQVLYGLDYRATTWRAGEDTPFHHEVGYWLWDAANCQVVRCFVIPHASTLSAGGTVAANDTTFKLSAERGSNTYGILTNQYLETVATTTRYDVTVTLTPDTYSYEQTTEVEYLKARSSILHTDRNTLVRRS
jgi:hypothetical protein